MDSEATRQLYLNIDYHWIMYLLLLPALASFGYGFWRKWQAVRAGKPAARFDRRAERLRLVARHLLLHTRLRRDPGSGYSHLAIFWGMLLLFIGTLVVAIEADFGVKVMQGTFYLVFQSLILDLVGLAATVGLAYMLVKRFVLRPERLASGKHDFLTAGLLLVIMLQGFVIEGLRIALTDDPWRAWSPVGWAFALPFEGMAEDGLVLAHQFFWWFHLVTVFGWIAHLPYTKMGHIFTGALNIYFADLEPRYQALQPVDFEQAEKLGITGPEDFTWKERLDLEACTECGRCQEMCPAYAADKPLSPRQLILDFRDGAKVAEESLWACTTCRACMDACPVLIEHVPKIVNMRRYLVMEQSEFPEMLQEASRSLENRLHPYKGAAASRTDWCEGLNIPTIAEAGEVDLLYWVGCTAAFDQRNQKTARALAQVMQAKGVSFAILGSVESCCGDPARRMGNEFLYDTVARGNVELLNSYRFKRIVTACPHCLHALGGEYRQFGGEFTVIHHTQLLAELGLTADQGSVTFHDPCYLGRWNNEYEAPRQVLGQVTEMDRNREQSFCCGAGGGHAWLEDEPGTRRINHLRAEQARATGCTTVATGCPFCLQMMEDGLKAVGCEESVVSRDVAELVWEAMARKGERPGERTQTA
ncbi:MAG: heterodisulfide reductase-related iron-sulfur binding cluster [Bacillota bacterium]